MRLGGQKGAHNSFGRTDVQGCIFIGGKGEIAKGGGGKHLIFKFILERYSLLTPPSPPYPLPPSEKEPLDISTGVLNLQGSNQCVSSCWLVFGSFLSRKYVHLVQISRSKAFKYTQTPYKLIILS